MATYEQWQNFATHCGEMQTNIRAHLPKPKTAVEIFNELSEYARVLPATDAGQNLLDLHLRVCSFIMRMVMRDIREKTNEADNFAAYLSDALGDSKAQNRYNMEQGYD